MAAKISWHRYETKLQHYHPILIKFHQNNQKVIYFYLSKVIYFYLLCRPMYSRQTVNSKSLSGPARGSLLPPSGSVWVYEYTPRCQIRDAIWRVTLNIGLCGIDYSWPQCANMTSPAKPEVHNTAQRLRGTELDNTGRTYSFNKKYDKPQLYSVMPQQTEKDTNENRLRK